MNESRSSHRGSRFPARVSRHAARSPDLSRVGTRDVEDRQFDRGCEVSCETLGRRGPAPGTASR